MEKKLPKEFLEKMKNIIPNYDEFIATFEKPSIKAIRVNTQKISVKEFEKIFPYKIKKIPYTTDGFYLEEEFKIGRDPYYHAGLFYSQDPAAQMPINAVKIEPDMRVLDMCAAPGGKSIQIASKLTNGFLIANEYNTKRAQILYSNIERMGLENVMVTNASSEQLSKNYEYYFDLVVVDAPCSGEGMFRKNDEAISEWSVENINNCVKRQKEILKNASTMVKENGLLLYSTCTYEKCENEEMIEWFAKNFNYEIVDLNKEIDNYSVKGIKTSQSTEKTRIFYPHIAPGEGQFVALLKSKNKGIEIAKTKDSNIPTKKEQEVIDEFLKNVDINIKPNIQNNKVFVKVTDQPININVISSGIQIGEIRNNYLYPNHNLLTVYGKKFKNRYNLKFDDEKLKAYLRGEEIEGNTEDGWGALSVEGYYLGMFKASNKRLKNHYPKGLRNI